MTRTGKSQEVVIVKTDIKAPKANAVRVRCTGGTQDVGLATSMDYRRYCRWPLTLLTNLLGTNRLYALVAGQDDGNADRSQAASRLKVGSTVRHRGCVDFQRRRRSVIHATRTRLLSKPRATYNGAMGTYTGATGDHRLHGNVVDAKGAS